MDQPSYINSINEPGQCPFCKTKYELSECEKRTGYGAALKRCPHCDNAYRDGNIRELAIYGILQEDMKLFIGRNLLTVLMGIGLTAALVFSILYSPVIYYFTALGPILIVVGIFRLIKDTISGKKKRVLLEKELPLSQQRINSPGYMETLREKGYQIYGTR